ncbi:PepSY-like domain-containing protein [Flavobacterium sp. RSSA_27]|uniref:PepSY-like domain-containing protein n=1 Tax=Flavobacterium sp. RSSA_27 TaxID=3447667 RepID=UPI003F337473
MRKSVIIVITLVLSTIAFAQKVKDTKVPEIVSKSLISKYPCAKKVKWDKEENNYEASFVINKTENSVLFNANGKIIETEVEITAVQLPKSIVNYISKNYKNQKVKEAAKIISEKGIVTYEAEIKGKDLLFDENGKLLSVS